jgi:hypothetical protein
MDYQPKTIVQSSFQLAWLEALKALSNSQWQLRNLVVHACDPNAFDEGFHEQVSGFCRRHRLLGPKHVAYTIFPHKQYAMRGSASEVFAAYNRPRGLYERLHTLSKGEWGTYFRRMTHYETDQGPVNQLRDILWAIRTRQQVWRAAYTVTLAKPGSEAVRPRGAPCLSYIAVQLEPGASKPVLGLLCVYRHHDFLERAYGNYWGLCNLARFLASEAACEPGPVTWVSSRAYVDRLKGPLRRLLAAL